MRIGEKSKEYRQLLNQIKIVKLKKLKKKSKQTKANTD